MRYYFTQKGLVPITCSDYEVFVQYHGSDLNVNDPNMDMVRWLLKNEYVLFLHPSENYQHQGFQTATLSLDTAALFVKRIHHRGNSLIVYNIREPLVYSNHEQDIAFESLQIPNQVYEGFIRKHIIDQFLADNP